MLAIVEKSKDRQLLSFFGGIFFGRMMCAALVISNGAVVSLILGESP